MKIAFIPSGPNPYNKHSWSGTDYYTRKALEDQGNEVYCIYGFEFKPSLMLQSRRIFDKLKGHPLDTRRTIEAAKQRAKFVSEHLQENTDLILSLGTLSVAYLDTQIPIFIMVDSIFEMHRSFYGGSGSGRFNREANEIERLALSKCKKIIPCSRETGDFIHRFYHVPQSKIEIVPLGANWDKAPDEEFVLQQLEKRVEEKVCKLLFVGVEWKRKGADIVIETLKELNRRGFPVELSVVGLKEIPIKLPPNVTNYGFLSKSNKEGAAKLEELFSSAHFLFVPSIAEAYGLVFCEANAYAVPNISHRKGGLTTIVEDGVNGQLFDLGTNPIVFADYIQQTFNNKQEYKRLCISSLGRYQSTLNWQASGEKICGVFSSIINNV